MRSTTMASIGAMGATLVLGLSAANAKSFPNFFAKKCEAVFESAEPVHQPSLRDFPILKYVYRDERARTALITVQRNIFQTPVTDVSGVRKLEKVWDKSKLKPDEQAAIYLEILEEFLDHNRHEVKDNAALTAWYTTHGELTSLIPGFQQLMVEYYAHTKSPVARRRVALMLFDIASISSVRFTPETLAFFDRMPFQEKLQLAAHAKQAPSLHNPDAQKYFAMWARSLELVQLKKELEAVLYKTVAEEHAQPQALANYVKQNIPADYSNPSMLKMVEDAERNAKLDRFANPVIRELARLIVFRLSHGMRWPDRGENPQSDRFVADSADTILMIISWMAESRMFGMADRDAAHVVALLKPITQNERDFLGSRTPLASRIASDRQITNVFERLTDSLSYTLRNEPAGQAPPATKPADQK